ncbi:MAG TPA: hypothetical protein VFB67_10860 [Candidatus Polarisedimenticolaceae bacterium]|nr:hypothetical protein [Candidatus Polarisedimenticolaceae bacterium]
MTAILLQNARSMVAPCAVLLLLAASGIRDNSFLIEEAYNQEAGVVQHISTFQRAWRENTWVSTFTQEWPLGGPRHQLSWSAAWLHPDAERGGHGIGDLALHWRFQIGGAEDDRAALAPRASVLFPTGNEDDGRGFGGPAFQGNLPLSVTLSERFVSHTNAGGTYVVDARNDLGESADLTLWNAGQSLIWLASPRVNVLAELLFVSAESVVAPERTERRHELFLSPGVRWSHDLSGGLQIVPGIAVPWGIGPSHGERTVFVYLSFEHAFR